MTTALLPPAPSPANVTQPRIKRSAATLAVASLSVVATLFALSACGGGGSAAPVAAPPVVAPPVVSPPIAPPPPPPPPPDPLTPQSGLSLGDATSTFAVASVDVGGDGGGDGGVGGGAGDGSPIARAKVTVTDRTGQSRTGQTNEQGNYFVRFPSTFQAPIVVKVLGPNGVVMASASAEPPAAGKVQRININPLTDKITSDSLAASVRGTDNAFTGTEIDAAKLANSTRDLVSAVRAALGVAGIAKTDLFDPIKSPYAYNGDGVDAVLESLVHSRNAATGATELRVKLAGVNNDAGGSARPVLLSTTTPLGTSQVAIASHPGLSFGKLNAWATQYNQCLASVAASTSAACVALVPRLRDASYIDNSKDFDEDFRLLMSNTGRTPVAGSVFRNPTVLFYFKSPGATIDDRAMVELTVAQPGTGPLAGNTAAPFEYVKAVVFRRDDTTAQLPASNWVLAGNQRPYDISVNTQYARREQVNPAMAADVDGQFPSMIETRLQFPVSTRKFDLATRSYVDSGLRGVVFKGPGLPAEGAAVSNISGTRTHTFMGNYYSDGIPASTSFTEALGNTLALARSNLAGGPLARNWRINNSNREVFAALNDPVTDFSGLGAFGRYTVEVYLRSSGASATPDLTATVYNLSEVAAPATVAATAVHDLGPSRSLVTAPAPAVVGPSTAQIQWLNNPLALAPTGARLFSGESSFVGVDYRGDVAETARGGRPTSLSLPIAAALYRLRSGVPFEERSLHIATQSGRAEFINELRWGNPTIDVRPDLTVEAPSATIVGVTATFTALGSSTFTFSNGAVEPTGIYQWRVGSGPSVDQASPVLNHVFASTGTFLVSVRAFSASGARGSIVFTSATVLSAPVPSLPPISLTSNFLLQEVAANTIRSFTIPATGVTTASRIFVEHVVLSSSGPNQLFKTSLITPTGVSAAGFSFSFAAGSLAESNNIYVCPGGVFDFAICRQVVNLYTVGPPPALPNLLSATATNPTLSNNGSQVTRRLSLNYSGTLNYLMMKIQLAVPPGGAFNITGAQGFYPFENFVPGSAHLDLSTSASVAPGIYLMRVCYREGLQSGAEACSGPVPLTLAAP